MGERRALILENGLGCVLPAARSLARAGWKVGIGAPFSNPRERGTRAVAERHTVPRPEERLDDFLAAVNDAVHGDRSTVVFPADDASVLAVSAHREQVHAVVPYAPHDVVLRSIDKLELTRAAEAAGVVVPQTVEATDSAIEASTPPVMVKPRLQWTPGTTADVGELFIERAEDRDAARRRVAEIAAAGGAAVLQAPITGRQIALSVVIDRRGRLAAAAQQLTLRYSLTQTSTRAVTLELDEELVTRVHALLNGLGWWGLANLQFLEPPGGAPHLIDLNGRFYGSIALAIAAGADLPAVWGACAVEDPPAVRQTARAGVRFHALESDLVRARREREPSLVSDVVSTLAFAPGSTHTLWSWRDPLPSVQWAGALGARLARRLLNRRGARGQTH